MIDPSECKHFLWALLRVAFLPDNEYDSYDF